jgi:hypothetical protein
MKQRRHTATNKPHQSTVETTAAAVWGARHAMVMLDIGTRCEFQPRLEGILSKTLRERRRQEFNWSCGRMEPVQCVVTAQLHLKASTIERLFRGRNAWVWLSQIATTATPSSGVPRGGWGFNPPPPKFQSFNKAEPNSQFREIYVSITT